MKWKENLKKRIIQNMWSSVCNDFIYRSKSACIIRHNWTFAFLYVFLSFYFWKISLELLASSVFFFLALICNRAKSLALFSKEIFQLKTSNIIFYSHTKWNWAIFRFSLQKMSYISIRTFLTANANQTAVC